MIKKLIRQMLAAQTVSALTVSVCLLIDNIMIGRFLGENALAAYGLANPVLLIIGALGSTLCAGVQVVCSRTLGKGQQEETNQGYSTAVIAAAVISLVFLIIVISGRNGIASLLGADSPELLYDTGTYMTGFAIGAPASIGALILVPFLQMAGQSNLLIAAVLGMTVADVGFDLLNALVFHGGMFGMGLASSLSYYVAVIIGGWYFFSSKCVFRFSLNRFRLQKVKELLQGGTPTIVGMAASVVFVFVMNKILLPTGGKIAVAAFAVANTIISACNCISTGSGGVALTMSGVLYHEEDRTGLHMFLGILLRYCVYLGLVVTVLLMIFAPACVSLFISKEKESFPIAVTAVRFMALALTPCCMNNALRSSYQGTGRVKLMQMLCVIDNFLLPAVFSLILSRIFGLGGTWFYFVLSEAFTLAGTVLYVRIKGQKLSGKAWDLLLLSKDVGVPKKDLLEADIHSMEEVLDYSRQSEQFCKSHGQNEKLGLHLALCIEEMGGNILQHGFQENKDNHLSIRLQYKNKRFILRFRDDCREFNPVQHIPEKGDEKNLGILLALQMSDEARYTYSMNLNNLVLEFFDIASETVRNDVEYLDYQ